MKRPTTDDHRDDSCYCSTADLQLQLQKIGIICFEKRDPFIKEYPRESNQSQHLRVTFELDERSQQVRTLVAQAASPCRKSASRQERSEIWYSRPELARIWNREKEVCNFYRSSEDDYAELLRQIFSRCSQHAYDSSSSSSQTEQDAGMFAARSSNRGLEHRVVNILSLHRQKLIQGVLDTQNRVQHLTPSQRQQMMRSKSNFLSRPAKNFAAVVAKADAITAQSSLHDPRNKITLEQFSDSFRRSESFRLSESIRWGESFRLGDVREQV